MRVRWQQLNSRERLLAGVIVILAIALSIMVVHRAVAGIQELDNTIAQRQETLIKSTEWVARSQSVDEAYARVAAQHSSAWTDATIYDRLRQEILRLAVKNVPEFGVPFTPRKDDLLVSIPTLHQGSLKTTEKGYRQYQLSFRVPGTSVENMFTFLERLQASNQSLRIDALQLIRSPTQESVSAAIDVTRTVVDDTIEAPASQPEVYLVTLAPELGESASDWIADGCAVEPSAEHVTRGPECLKAHSSAPGATFFLRQEVDADMTYALSVDVTASGSATLAIADDSQNAYAGAVDIVGDGEVRLYRVRFVTPAAQDGPVAVCAPFFTLTESGTEIFVDNVTLDLLTE